MNERASAALLPQARDARTPREFNQALRALMQSAGRTQGDIVRHDKEAGQELSKSTVSRMVSGERLVTRAEQISAFVIACGVGRAESWAWVQTWQNLREGGLPNTAPTDAVLLDEEPAGESTVADLVDQVQLAGVRAGDQDVVLNLRVRITRQGASRLGLGLGATVGSLATYRRLRAGGIPRRQAALMAVIGTVSGLGVGHVLNRTVVPNALMLVTLARQDPPLTLGAIGQQAPAADADPAL